MSASAILPGKAEAVLTERFADPECLHPIQQPRRYVPYILNPHVASRRYPTVLLECLKDLPSGVTVLVVSGGAIGEEEGFDGFGSKDIAAVDEHTAADDQRR